MANYTALPPINVTGSTPTSFQQPPGSNVYYHGPGRIGSGIPHQQQQQDREQQVPPHSSSTAPHTLLPPPHQQLASSVPPSSSGPYSLSSLIHPTHHTGPSTSSPSQNRGMVMSSSGPEPNAAALMSPTSSASAGSSPAQPLLPSIATHSTSDQSPGAGPSSNANDDHKRSRACDHCRALKVRCVPHDENDPAGTCHRCYKSSRQCVFTVNARKRQKRTDTRVADLEKKLDELTARLAATKGQNNEDTIAERELLKPRRADEPPVTANGQMLMQTDSGGRGDLMAQMQAQNMPPPQVTVNGNSYPTPPLNAVMQQQPQQTQVRPDFSSISGLAELASLRPDELSAFCKVYNGPLGQPFDVRALRFVQPQHIEDVLRRYNVSEEMAQKAFEYFIYNMLPHMPFIYFSPNAVFRDVLVSKPLTTLSILAMTIAKTKDSLEISSQLMAELYRIVSEQLLVIGNKTLDLIQCLMIMCIWYNPPEIYECNKVNIFTNCAITVARELGLHRPSRIHGHRKAESIFRAIQSVDTQSLECRRSWLGLYVTSCVLNMLFRDAEVIRWSTYLDQCCEVLDVHDGLPSDRTLVRLARLHQIIENIADIFHPLDCSDSVEMNDKRLVHMIRVFERNLSDWRSALPEEDQSNVLLLTSYYSAQIYLHEVGLHNKTNRNDFTVPFTEDSIKPSPPQMTPYHAEAIVWCIATCHGLIDLFCSCDIPLLSFVPVHCLGRVTYACTILLKIALTVIKTNSLTSVCSLNMVRPEYYLGRTYQKLVVLCGEGPASLIALKFKYILGKLYLWFHTQKASTSIESGESSRMATPQSSVQSNSSSTDADRASVSFRTVPEYESKMVSSFNSTHASTLEMLSSVAVQEQQTTSNDGRANSLAASMLLSSYSPDEEIRMPGTNMTVYEHIREEHLLEQRQQQQRRDSASNAAPVNGPNSPLPMRTTGSSYSSAPVAAEIDTDAPMPDDAFAPPSSLDLSQLLVDDQFWIDVFYRNNGQIPNVEMSAGMNNLSLPA
ncbi:hypothetical protein V1517DRAFT_325666 [Lipomyces orientalis]|uniref:Uncharacterized protein n=1 Tax=Lipomyces orientalis TaxID=1233043 RepID=A0ACC3TKI9_9ASCO